MSEQSVPPRPAKPRPLSERRAFVRYPCQQNSSCHSIRSGGPDCWPATFANISIGGLSLRVRRPFQEGEVLTLELEQPVAGFLDRLFVKVIHATAEPGGFWIVGCRFVDTLTDYELDALL